VSRGIQRGARRRRPVVGMLMTSLVNLYQVQWLGAVDAAREHGVSLVTFVGRELESPLGFDAHANAIYDLVGAETVDGVILWSTALQLFAGPERLHTFSGRFEPLPLVSMEHVLPGHPSLLLDNRGGMCAAVSHLIERHGCEQIAFVRGPAHHLGAQERYEGYLDALAAHGLPADPKLVSPHPRSWYPDEPAAWLKRLLEVRAELDAVAAVNDAVAGGVLAALEERGVRVPDELGVTGFDDLAGGFSAVGPIYRDPGLGREDQGTAGGALERGVNLSASTLPLTTVRTPFYELGWRAVELVLAQLDGQPVADVEVRPTELVVRRSCGCLAPLTEGAVAAGVGDAGGGGAMEALDELSKVYRAELAGESGNPFLRRLDELVRASMRSGRGLEAWWEVLRELRQRTGDDGAADAASADALWSRTQRLMEETAERFMVYQGLLVEKRNQLVREVGQRLVTTLDPAELADALADQLPNLEIPSCYLSAYAGEGAGDGRPPQRSRALLVQERGRTRELAPESAVFPTERLAPKSLECGDPRSLVALPLYFKDQQLGFVVFEVGPRLGWMYEALQQQLSSVRRSRPRSTGRTTSWRSEWPREQGSWRVRTRCSRSRSSNASRRKRRARSSKRSSAKRRRWKRSGGSRAGSRMTSTTCWSSSTGSASCSSIRRRTMARCAGISSRSAKRASGPPT
jgi:DNA-binding LacI/PurR family transcriptional regulator